MATGAPISKVCSTTLRRFRPISQRLTKRFLGVDPESIPDLPQAITVIDFCVFETSGGGVSRELTARERIAGTLGHVPSDCGVQIRVGLSSARLQT